MVEPAGIVPASFRAELGSEIIVEEEVYKYTGWSEGTTYVASSLWDESGNFSFFHNGLFLQKQ